jgi:hypothetical protein
MIPRSLEIDDYPGCDCAAWSAHCSDCLMILSFATIQRVREVMDRWMINAPSMYVRDEILKVLDKTE